MLSMKDLGLSEEKIEDEIIKAVEVLNHFYCIPRDQDCGFFTLLDGKIGKPVLLKQIGLCPSDKLSKYVTASLENANSLFQDVDSVTNFRGAIRVGRAIFSFAGLPDKANEAVMLYLMYQAKLLEKEQAVKLALVSNNALLDDLLLYGGTRLDRLKDKS